MSLIEEKRTIITIEPFELIKKDNDRILSEINTHLPANISNIVNDYVCLYKQRHKLLMPLDDITHCYYCEKSFVEIHKNGIMWFIINGDSYCLHCHYYHLNKNTTNNIIFIN